MTRFIKQFLLTALLIFTFFSGAFATTGEQIDFLLSGVEGLKNGTITSFASGSTTPKNVFTNKDLATGATTTISLDSRGIPASSTVYYGTGLYRFVYKDSDGVTLYTKDDIGIGLSDGFWTNASEFDDLKDAIDTIGATVTDLLIDEAIELEDGNGDDEAAVVPATMKLIITKTGSIVMAGTESLTINGSLDAGMHEIFTGARKNQVLFGVNSIAVVHPEWWGALESATASANATAFQAALDSRDSTSPQKLLFSAGIYSYDTTLTFDIDHAVIQGSGMGIFDTGAASPAAGTILKYTGTSNAISITDGRGLYLSDLAVVEDDASGDADGGILIGTDTNFAGMSWERITLAGFNKSGAYGAAVGAGRFVTTTNFYSCAFTNNYNGFEWDSSASPGTTIRFYGVSFTGNTNNGLFLDQVESVTMFDPVFESNGDSALRITEVSHNYFRMFGGHFEGSATLTAGFSIEINGAAASSNTVFYGTHFADTPGSLSLTNHVSADAVKGLIFHNPSFGSNDVTKKRLGITKGSNKSIGIKVFPADDTTAKVGAVSSQLIGMFPSTIIALWDFKIDPDSPTVIVDRTPRNHDGTASTAITEIAFDNWLEWAPLSKFFVNPNNWEVQRRTDFTFIDGDVTPAADTIDETGHGFSTGDTCQLTTDGVLPAGLALNTVYYVIKVDADTISLANSLVNADAGTAVDITGAVGGGTHTLTETNFSFDGENDQALSIIALIREVDATGSTKNIFSKHDSTTGVEKREYQFRVNNDRTLVGIIYDEANNDQLSRTTTSTLTADTWHCVAMTYDGNALHTGIELYLDGDPIADGGATGGTYAAMVATTALPASYETNTAGSKTNYFEGFQSVVAVITEEATPTEVSGACALLQGYAGTL